MPSLPSVRLPRALLWISSPISAQHETATSIWLRCRSSESLWQGAREHLMSRPSSMSSAGCHRRRPLPVALCQKLATSLAGLHKRPAPILMEHLSLRSQNVSLSKSTIPVTPSRPAFCYTCSAEQPDGWQAGRSSDTFHSRCASSEAVFSLRRSLSLACGSGRRNTLKQRFQRETLLGELALRSTEVDPHRCQRGRGPSVSAEIIDATL